MDRPQPSRHYIKAQVRRIVVFLVLIPVFLFIFQVMDGVWLWHDAGGYGVGTTLLLLLAAGWYLYRIHAAYHTEYRIERGSLWLRSGVERQSIALDRLTIPEANQLGTGLTGSKSFSNRIQGQLPVALKNWWRSDLVVTPSDPERFIAALRAHMAAPQSGSMTRRGVMRLLMWLYWITMVPALVAIVLMVYAEHGHHNARDDIIGLLLLSIPFAIAITYRHMRLTRQ